MLRDGGSIYVADLSKRCIHIVDAMLHWGHAEEALFTLKEFEAEANRRGFATVHKTSDLGLEGYFRFRKETLCPGGKRCDFRFVRHDTDAGDGWEHRKNI